MSARYIIVREADGFASTIIGPITYPLTSKGWNQRRDGKSHIQAMRQRNRSDVAYYRSLGKTVTIERSYPTLRMQRTARQRVGHFSDPSAARLEQAN